MVINMTIAKTKLERIEIYEAKLPVAGQNQYELRLDWSNDRHQAIAIDDITPDAVREAMLKMVHLLTKEQQNEYL